MRRTPLIALLISSSLVDPANGFSVLPKKNMVQTCSSSTAVGGYSVRSPRSMHRLLAYPDEDTNNFNEVEESRKENWHSWAIQARMLNAVVANLPTEKNP